MGCTVNFKTHRNSIWDKKKRLTPEEEQAVFYNTQQAIITEEVFGKVQQIRQQRHRMTKTGKGNGKRRQSIHISYDFVGFIPIQELMQEDMA